MRKILIDSVVKEMAISYRLSIIESGLKKIIVSSLDNLISEIKEEKPKDYKCYIKYLRFIRLFILELIVLQPEQYDSLGAKLDDRWNCILGWKKSSQDQSFADRVVKALHYSTVRKYIFPRYVQKLNIKTCVYCNTQYALTLENDDTGEISAYYELDHAWPKADYPFLAISFFNLHPCCGSCNKRKSNTPEHYSIYTDKPSAESSVRFSIERESLVNYILNHHKDELKVDILVKDEKLSKLYNQIGVRNLYSKFNDDAEELVWKAKIYNDSYFEQLNKAYGVNYLKSRSNIFRFMYGVYADEENVYTRPLTKMKQDIAKQLQLL